MHLSIDFWRTIAFSNPIYSEKRLDFLEGELMAASRSVISDSLQEIGKFADNYNVSGHLQIHEMYVLLLKLVSKKVNDAKLISRHDPVVMRETIDSFFEEHPPILNTELFEMIEWGMYDSVNLSTNTGYISGKLIKSFLENNLTHFRIDFYACSDELQCSKPQSKFFTHVLSNSKNRQVTHLGDDLFADIYGANLCGLDAIYYNNNILTEYRLNEKHSNFQRLNHHGEK
jgi:hypothetical protein